MSMSGGNGGGDPNRFAMNPLPSAMPDRRRPRKNIGGNYYNGPRDNRGMNSNYRNDNRMNSRSSGGSGDGLHNGSGYRGNNSSGGLEYDSQHQSQSCISQCGPAQAPTERSSSHHHHQQQTQGGHYGSHQYGQQQQQHHHHHHHSQHQAKNQMEYDGPNRPPRANHHSTMDHHRNVGVMHQPHQDVGHVHPPPQQYGGVTGATGGAGHHPIGGEIVVVAPPQEQHYPGGNISPTPVQGHFQPGAAPQQIPGPAVGFFGYPNGPPVMGSLVLCHIPYGLNPASVIAPGVQTQLIGCGYLNPTVQYNYACAIPSPLIQTQPLIFQQPPPHYAHPQPHFHQLITTQPPHPPQATGVDDSTSSVIFDSAAILNPDANAFFPSLSSFSEDVDDEEVGTGDGPSSEIGGLLSPKRDSSLVDHGENEQSQKEESSSDTIILNNANEEDEVPSGKLESE